MTTHADEWRTALYADDSEPDRPDPGDYAGMADEPIRTRVTCPACGWLCRCGGAW